MRKFLVNYRKLDEPDGANFIEALVEGLDSTDALFGFYNFHPNTKVVSIKELPID